MNDQNNLEDEKPIAGQLTYFNILAQSIQRVNDAIMQDKDARDAAENLLSDLPDEWISEVQERIDKENDNYNNSITHWNQYLEKGTAESLKIKARKEIYLSGKSYSRVIKNIVISLLKKKDLLYQTKKKIEQGAISLWELTGEKPPKDDDDE